MIPILSTTQIGGGATPFNPIVLSPYLDIDPGKFGLNDGNAIGTATDYSGNGRNFTQATAGNKPTFKTAIVNGLPVMRFDGVDDYLQTTGWPTNLVSAELWIVLKIVSDPPSPDTKTGFMEFGSTVVRSHFPYTDGTIYDQFGTDTRKTTVNPTPSLASAFHLYHVISKSGEWTSELDGTQLFTTATNTVGWNPAPLIGAGNHTDILGDPSGTPYVFAGDMARLLITPELSAGNRTKMKTYVGTVYGLTIS
jgi:hypothetical protein